MGIIYDGWDGILGILVTAPVLYLAVIALIRVLGKRSTSQMNNFDWIVTVAIGSVFASGVILDSITLVESLLAVGLLATCQFALTWGMTRSDRLAKLVKPQPTLLLHRGELLWDNMRRERITEAEVLAALRENGIWRRQDAGWVIFETDATLSVVPLEAEAALPDANALTGVAGLPKT